MDDKDRQILALLRKGISFSSKPFQEISSKTGVGTSEIFLRLLALRDAGTAGLLTAVLNPRGLGVQSVLTAARLPARDSEFERARLCLQTHPGIVKTCRRFHDFNFWFHLVLPPGQSISEHLQKIKRLAGAQKILALPAIKKFRAGEESEVFPAGWMDLSELEVEALRKIQDDVPLVDRPFQKWARDLGISETDFLEILKKFSKRDVLKRFSLLFPDEEKSARAQDMTLWQVPEEKLEAAARAISGLSCVARCVIRAKTEDFPYSLYVEHSQSGQVSEKVILEIQKQAGSWPWIYLPVIQSFESKRLFYFSKDAEFWPRSSEKNLNIEV